MYPSFSQSKALTARTTHVTSWLSRLQNATRAGKHILAGVHSAWGLEASFLRVHKASAGGATY